MAEVKEYKISQIEGKITWEVQELWEGGTVRGPYGSKEAAMNAELRIAEENGFVENLVLAGLEDHQTKPQEAFEKAEDGAWTCIQACSINIDNKEIVFTEGLQLAKDELYMGVNVTEWLEENVSA